MQNWLPWRAEHQLAASYLRHATGQAVYDYFEERSSQPSGNDMFSGHDSDELFDLLLSRNDPLINLALARFTSHEETLSRLWARGDRDLRVAIAGNLERDDLRGLTDEAILEMADSDDELPRRLVFLNPSVSLRTVKAAFDREQVFSLSSGDRWAFTQLSDGAWLNIVTAAIWAPALRKAIDVDVGMHMGSVRWAECRSAFESAWLLLLKLPPSVKFADDLAALYNDIAEVNIPDEMLLTDEERAEKNRHFEMVFPLTREDDEENAGDGGERRAQTVAENASESAKGSAADYHESRWSELVRIGRQRFLDAAFLRWQPEDRGCPHQARGFERLRQVIARVVCGHIDDSFLRDHSDRAVRAGFYEDCDSLSVENAEAALGKDGEQFLMILAGRPWMHRPTKIAGSLRSMAEGWPGWHGDGRDAWRKKYRECGVALWQEDPAKFAHPDHDQAECAVEENTAQEAGDTDRDDVAQKLARLERRVAWIGNALIFGAAVVVFYHVEDAIERSWNAGPLIAGLVSVTVATALATWLGRRFDKV